MRERERELRSLLTDYHHAAAQANKIRSDAQARAAKITADAETHIAALHERADIEASAFEDAAHNAVRAILQSGEPRGVVADLARLTTAQVRAIERAQPTAATTQQRTRSARQPDNDSAPPAEAGP